ncbi:PREDICTED: N-acetylglucosaminyl-phosphatidylinositol de-N-acetylase-like [Priapulus caudatus]|uniref:N-acetylglucosaminylphosphatidylinositol deacetylase n=1 Tax=Priapulus caudatus TaxID=37621 RepID=A0ABM1FC30_PRICU|nr:PREDICTED: N-acetylglucosaminyl-phosphatidylinositol de-N-acetylase-like [Priapulus caudatus]
MTMFYVGLMTLVVVVTTALMMLGYWISWRSQKLPDVFRGSGFSDGLRKKKSRLRTLIVTAHPDDECMFFSPLIQHLVQLDHKVFLLCLSSGDFYGMGTTRIIELLSSSRVLGIDATHVTVLNDKNLLDNASLDWEPAEVEKHIVKALRNTQADIIISFDGYGVSGHSNHRAIHRTLSKMLKAGHLHKGKAGSQVHAFMLESVAIYRKYCGFFDATVSMFLSPYTVISTPTGYITALRAMVQHWSQLVWFRMLYVAFSRYMMVNTLVPLDATEICNT